MIIVAVLLLLAILMVGGAGYLLRASQSYDPYTAEHQRPELKPTCGARQGHLVCTLQPHDTGRHLDETAGTQYHSASFTA